jgi:hypothetical protein
MMPVRPHFYAYLPGSVGPMVPSHTGDRADSVPCRPMVHLGQDRDGFDKSGPPASVSGVYPSTRARPVTGCRMRS